MKCRSNRAAVVVVVIRTVCLVLSAQIVAFSDAKSIEPVASPSTTDRLQGSPSAALSAEHSGRGDGHFHLIHAARTNDHNNSLWRKYAPVNSVYTPKYTIDQLMEHVYETRISNDIDLDPCKTGKSPQLIDVREYFN